MAINRLILLFAAPAVLAAGLLAMAGSAQQQTAMYESPAETRAALRIALAERATAEKRSIRLEQEAKQATGAAQQTARKTAALAARIQQAEAGIVAAEARISMINRESAALRELLGREQQPVMQLTAALQQFSRRPVALSVLRPGEVKDIVYLQAMLSNAVPEVESRTANLRGQINRSQQLAREAQQARQILRAEESSLAKRQQQLAGIESRQRLASRQASGAADREAERALALGEQARDLDSLMGELDRAANLRRQLAALSGPMLRPASPQQAVSTPTTTAQAPVSNDARPPSPYIVPVAGRTVTGFGAPQAGGTSRGLTMAPRGGAQIVAPAAGRVAFSGIYRGYGQIVIIEHDGGWTSLITGLARSDVSVGEDLVGGAPLGVAGPSTPQNRPAVTLELRRDGEPVNPLQFVG